VSNEQQTQQADDPSGPDNQLADRIRAAMLASGLTRYQLSQQTGIAQSVLGRFASGERDLTLSTASRLVPTLGLDLMATDTSDSEPQAINPDDPSGPGWRDVGLDEPIEQGDVYTPDGYNWLESDSIGRRPIEFPNRLEYPHLRYRRRIEPQQPSDSEPETMEDLRRRLAECEVLLAEAEISGEQVNARLQQLREQARDLTRQTQVDALELQQLREQVQTLTQERDRLQSSLRDHHKDGQQALAGALQTWLRPVLELVAEHPEDCGPLAVSILGYLPGIASRLIEE
jgi:transcriptional regulator with XRE-family HTH domain